MSGLPEDAMNILKQCDGLSLRTQRDIAYCNIFCDVTIDFVLYILHEECIGNLHIQTL